MNQTLHTINILGAVVEAVVCSVVVVVIILVRSEAS